MTLARQRYRIDQWGDGYFDIDDRGALLVCPDGGDRARSKERIPLANVIAAAREQGLSLPLLVRFNEILSHRVNELAGAFMSAISQRNYDGAYHPVYPIKVNQQRSVVETIAANETVDAGFECGSKPELLAVMATIRAGGLIVCNGYKDRDYIKLALIATRIGFRCYLVIEKLSELELVIDESRELGVRPLLGLRARLARVSRGHWQNTGGVKSKFGFSAINMLEALEKIDRAGLSDCVRLLHIHLGSQISSLDDIASGVEEAARYYTALRRKGCPIETLDLGGGLGINYDGMSDLGVFSINYRLQDYADTLVATVAGSCKEDRQPCPELLTESGRALTAHHAVLITDVVDQEISLHGEPAVPGPDAHPVLHDFAALLSALRTDKTVTGNDRQRFEQANSLMATALDVFSSGQLDLEARSQAERTLQAICQVLLQRQAKTVTPDQELKDELRERLARRLFINLSVFQSLPDIWALNQVFPIVPLQRLDQEPQTRATLCDLTCDSDGKIAAYVDGHGLANTLAIHDFADGEQYLLGIFLVGAYQEILGDMHNLFGDTDSVDVVRDADSGFRLVHAEPADTAGQVLAYVHFEPDQVLERIKRKLDASDLQIEQRKSFLAQVQDVLSSSTYLGNS